MMLMYLLVLRSAVRLWGSSTSSASSVSSCRHRKTLVVTAGLTGWSEVYLLNCLTDMLTEVYVESEGCQDTNWSYCRTVVISFVLAYVYLINRKINVFKIVKVVPGVRGHTCWSSAKSVVLSSMSPESPSSWISSAMDMWLLSDTSFSLISSVWTALKANDRTQRRMSARTVLILRSKRICVSGLQWGLLSSVVQLLQQLLLGQPEILEHRDTKRSPTAQKKTTAVNICVSTVHVGLLWQCRQSSMQKP